MAPAVAQEPLEAVPALQSALALEHGAFDQAVVVQGKGGEAHGGQQGGAGVLGVGLPGQQGLQGGAVAVVGVDVDVDDRPAAAVVAVQVEAVHGLEGGLGHADGAGVELALVVVVLGAALEHAVVGYAVGALDVEDEVLHEVDLVDGEDDLQAGGGHLRERDEEEGHAVDLQVAVVGVGELLAGGDVEAGVEGVGGHLVELEALELVGLLHPAEEDAAHGLDGDLAEVVGPAEVAVDFGVALAQGPDGDGTINRAADVGDVGVSFVVGVDGEEAGGWALVLD